MSNARGQRRGERTLPDMLGRGALRSGGTQPATTSPAPTRGADSREPPVTRSFLESLFSSLREDFQTLKREVAGEVREVRREMDSLGDRVNTVEEAGHSRDEEITHLQQEVLRLREQQIELQAHAEDLENRSRRNNIRVRGVPSGEEGEDVTAYLVALFRAILGEPEDFRIRIDRAHRVGRPRRATAPAPDILAFLPNFPLKERILREARGQQPFRFRDHPVTLFQDLSTVTLQKRKSFKIATDFLREHETQYSWGHPFRLIFRWNGVLHQLRSLQDVCDVLGLTATDTDTPAPRRRRSNRNGWQRAEGGASPPVERPGSPAIRADMAAAIQEASRVATNGEVALTA